MTEIDIRFSVMTAETVGALTEHVLNLLGGGGAEPLVPVEGIFLSLHRGEDE